MAQQLSPVREGADHYKNLAAAKQAIKYVDNCMKYGACNDPYDIYNKSRKSTCKSVALKTVLSPLPVIELSKGIVEISKVVLYPKKTSEFRVEKMRAAVLNDVKGRKDGVQKKFEIRAKMAIKHGCGNCGEQAWIAFHYLKEKKCVL